MNLITTTLLDEELVSELEDLVVKKVWDTSKSKPTSETYILRKKYDNNDFLLLNEHDLIALCRQQNIAHN